VSNLLLITDVARLRKIFGRLTDDKNIRLRVVTNLEKGGEEIALEKPDVVFVQTHLSGLSADILLMHLKKQLGRKRSRFILLAAPGQINETILKPYQGWLDTSSDDNEFLSELQQLLANLLNKRSKSAETGSADPIAPIDFIPQPVSSAESSSLLERSSVIEAVPPKEVSTELQPAVSTTDTAEPSLEDQGLTYAPRQRLSVNSEFNSSFDSAVSSTPDPETLEQATPPLLSHDWNAESLNTIAAKSTRSKRGVFLLWLAPVIVAVVVITYLQQQRPSQKAEPAAAKTAQAVKPAVTPSVASVPITPRDAKITIQAAPKDQDKTGDMAVLSAISEKRGQQAASRVKTSIGLTFTTPPKFIPIGGLVKKYGEDNPGWELYMGKVTEFRVLKKDKTIKAVQVIDRGWQGISERFMKRAFLEVTNNNPVYSVLTSEKKDGYEIQRGSIAANIKVVYYRDEKGGKLRAFVLTW